MLRDEATLLDIVQATRRALRYTAGVEYPSFLKQEEKRWAVYSQIVIIGEAARRLSQGFQDSNPNVPWAQVKGMRIRLVHEYDQVSWERVWETVAKDLPQPLTWLEPLLPEEQP